MITPVMPMDSSDLLISGNTVTIGGVVSNAAELVSAVKSYRADKDQNNKVAMHIMLMLGIAALLKILISILKFTSEFWKSDSAPNVLRIIAVLLGVAVYLVSTMATGESWQMALLLGLAGPMSIAVNELVEIIKSMLTKKPAVVTPVTPVGPTPTPAPVKS